MLAVMPVKSVLRSYGGLLMIVISKNSFRVFRVFRCFRNKKRFVLIRIIRVQIKKVSI